MMELDFRDGNPRDAAAMLRQGRHLVITEEYHQLKGLKVGDKLALKTPDTAWWTTRSQESSGRRESM